MQKFIIAIVFSLSIGSLLSQPVLAETKTASFAKCTRECTKANKACVREAKKKCEIGDWSCLDKCNAEFPKCTAKCKTPSK